MKKIAVLSTSDIQRITDRGPESTGRLERAIEQGFTVFVGSDRTKTGEYDQWWIDLVGSDRVFLADGSLDRTIKNHHEFCNSGWQALFAAQRVDWPLDSAGRPMFHTEAVPWLYRTYDVGGPRDFDKED